MRRLLIALALAALPAAMFAATATGTINISANVQAAGTCTTASGGLGYGNVTPPLVGNLDSSAALTVTCPTLTPYTVTLSAGGSGNQLARKMTGTAPTDLMSYNLYTSDTYTTVFGDGTGGTGTLTGTGSGIAQYLYFYARIPPQATPPPGNYSDVITITVTY